MAQFRIYKETNEATARTLQSVFEHAFEDDGYPVAAFEDIDKPGHWTVSVYVDEENLEAVVRRMYDLSEQADIDIRFEQEKLPDVDWVAETLRDLHAVRAGRFVVHGSHDMSAPAVHEKGILIDAGLAFGTGHHGTTAGCLDMLTAVLKKRRFTNVLDLGTGSGVLAIAAARVLQAHVLASDIDDVATQTARRNAHLNGVHASVECITSDGLSNRRFAEQGPFDLVIANILARPLMAMSREIALQTAHGGTIILSGLLPHQRRMILATFRQQGLLLERYHLRDGWLTIVLRKP